MTGDAGFFDEDGHPRSSTGPRTSGKLTGGGMFAPNYIENKLKFFQHIKEVVASAISATSSPPSSTSTSGRRQLGRAQGHGLLGLHRPGQPAPGV